MKSRTNTAVAARAVAAILIAASATQAGQVSWQRQADWTPGTPGAVSGQPGPGGPAVWQYEYAMGGALNSANPWYTQPSTPLVYDENWWGINEGAWARNNDVNPPIFQNRVTHNTAPSVAAYVPIVRWNGQVPGVPVSITGDLTVKWTGRHGVGRPMDVDVIVAKQNANHSVTTLLYSSTIHKPNPFPSVGDFVSLPVNLSNVTLGTGESIIISLRGRSTAYAWLDMRDNITINPVPAPAGMGVLAMAGLAAARRRRR